MLQNEKIWRACDSLLEQKVQKLVTKYALEKMWWKPVAVQEKQITIYRRKAFSSLQQRVSMTQHRSEWATSNIRDSESEWVYVPWLPLCHLLGSRHHFGVSQVQTRAVGRWLREIMNCEDAVNLRAHVCITTSRRAAKQAFHSLWVVFGLGLDLYNNKKIEKPVAWGWERSFCICYAKWLNVPLSPWTVYLVGSGCSCLFW